MTPRWRGMVAPLLLLLLGQACPQVAQALPGELGSNWTTGMELNLSGRFNPVGASVGGRATVRRRLFHEDHVLRKTGLGNVLLAPSAVGLAVTADTSPAYVRAGVGLEFMPAAVWRMRLTWQATQTFGNFGFLMKFEDRTDPYGPIHRVFRGRVPGAMQARLVQRLMAENLFQVKLWRIILFNLTNVELGRVGPGGGWFYNGEYDLLVRGAWDVVGRNVFLAAVSVLDGKSMPELAVGGFHMVAASVWSRGVTMQAGAAVVVGPPVRGIIPRSASWIILAGFHLWDRHRQSTPYLVWLMSLAF